MSDSNPKDPLQEELDQLFADLWKASQFAGHRRAFRPAVDTSRCDDPPRLLVVVELPGIDPATTQIVLQGRDLVVAGERLRPQMCGRRFLQMEIAHGPFQRRIHLHENVDPAQATASYEEGLLTIMLPIAKGALGSFKVPIKLSEKPDET